MMLINKIMM